jgi:alpha-glucoside transport system permease protein
MSTPTPPPPEVEESDLEGLKAQVDRMGAGQTLAVSGLRILSAFAVPVVAFFLLWVTFEWLRDSDANRGVIVIVAIVVGVVGVFGLFWGMDYVVNQLPMRFRESVRPFVFVGPALVVLSLYLVYPAINTIIISFKDATSQGWVGLDNYRFVFTDASMLRSIRNTVGWIVIVPAFSVSIGLVFATLADKLRRGEAFAKSLIFLPMAISFVGASVVWRFIYSFRPEGFGEPRSASSTASSAASARNRSPGCLAFRGTTCC